MSHVRSRKSGRFVLRMPPTLHARLHDAAQSSGLSLNAFCVRSLLAVDVGIGSEDVTSLLARARAVTDGALNAVVLHGSWVRGESTPGSDVDALLVIDSRLALSRQLYRAWDSEPVRWRGRLVDPHFVHPAAEGEYSGLWAEVALDGIVLVDRDWKVSKHLAHVRSAIAAGRLARSVVHGQPYWTQSS